MRKLCLRLCLLLTLFVLASDASKAQTTDRLFKADLIGYEEVPAISSTGVGDFSLVIDFGDTRLNYTLRYSPLTAPIQQAHLHFGQKGVNGGIVFFICTNLGNGPAGTQPCPAGPATLTGTITASDIVGGASAQGISPGEFAEVLRAIRSGTSYVNVHSSTFPGGEIRGQVVPDVKK